MNKQTIIPITDDRGRVLLDGTWIDEPLPGSVVMSNGVSGTAWQRQYSDGLWHRVGNGRGKTWEQMLNLRGLCLIYTAPPRPVFEALRNLAKAAER